MEIYQLIAFAAVGAGITVLRLVWQVSRLERVLAKVAQVQIDMYLKLNPDAKGRLPAGLYRPEHGSEKDD